MSTDPDAPAPEGGEATGAPTGPLVQPPTEITFRYGKSRFCRVIHADGVWGGVTPQGNMHMAFYSEHRNVPETVTYPIDQETGALIDPSGVLGDLVREIEVQVVLNREVAAALITWLTDKVKTIDRFRAQTAERTPVEK